MNDVVIAYLGQASNLILDYEIDLLNLFISSIILSALYSMYKKPDYGLGIISMDTSFRDICHYMQEKDVRALLLGSFALLIPDLIVLFLISLVFGLKKIKQHKAARKQKENIKLIRQVLNEERNKNNDG